MDANIPAFFGCKSYQLRALTECAAGSLRTRLRRLISNDPRLAERLEVHSINAIGERLYLRAHTLRTQFTQHDHKFCHVHEIGRSHRQE
jgi:hypothetical protein